MIKFAFPVLFAGIWIAIVGGFDAFVGYNLYRALRAQSFATTTGAVTHSEVTRHSDSDGSTYGVDIRYGYWVNGDKLEGATYRYGAGSSSDSDWAHEAVREHRVGAEVTVYYDPKEPSQSVLKPGIDASDMFMLLFLTPFNLVLAAMLWFGAAEAWHWWHGTKPKLVTWFRDAAGVRVRLPDQPAIVTGFMAAGFAAFASIFIVAFSSGFHPSMTFVQIMWALVLGAGFGTGFWLWRKEQQGAFDLLIGDRSVELPAMYGRESRETLEKRAIAGVAVQKIEHRGKHGPSYTYAISLQRRGGSDAKVAEWSDERSAIDLAAWLREQIGVR